MNSSIFISEPPDWRATLRLYAAAAIAIGLAVGALLVMLDPYDTGRFALIGGSGTPVVGQRLAAASLARRPEMAGAIVGNSTIQLVDPARLAALTGVRFVSLAIPGTGPLEQLAVADWYLRHHPGGGPGQARAIVFGLDQSWCQADGRLDIANPFPFWLYSTDTVDYVGNLLRLKTFEIAERKLKVVFGRSAPLRADGYRDYDSGKDWEAAAHAELALPAEDGPLSQPLGFAAVPRLRAFLAGLPADTDAVLLFPPRHANALPVPGSGAAAAFAGCKQAYRELAAGRGRTVVVDMAVDGEIARDDRLFWDRVHYRLPVARLVEDSIARSIGRRPAARD